MATTATSKSTVLYMLLITTLGLCAWTFWQNQQQADDTSNLLAESVTTIKSTEQNQSKPAQSIPDQPQNKLVNSSVVAPNNGLPNTQLPSVTSQRYVNLFKAQQWVTPTKYVAKVTENQVFERPPPPVLPFVYLGQFQDKSGLVIYLMGKTNLYTVAQGELIDQQYRLESISESAIVLTYLPENIRQTLFIKRNS